MNILKNQQKISPKLNHGKNQHKDKKEGTEN